MAPKRFSASAVTYEELGFRIGIRVIRNKGRD
jgi:hypothetical protein